MKLFKRILVVIGVIIFFLALNLTFYLSGLEPEYNGEKNMSGISSDVEVIFDTYGVPHIYAENNTDAYRALGYVHAQDRLWQMELMRRIAPGRLSEIFGPDLIETDKFFKTLGIHRVTKMEVEQLNNSENEELKEYIDAYLAGVNQFMEEGPTPIEFLILGLDKEPYTSEDIYNVMGYIGFSFARAQKTDPIMTKIVNELGEDYAFDLDIVDKGTTERIRNYKVDKLDQILAKTHSVLNSIPAPIWTGSNSWVVSPQKSATGQVIFANDPHMGISQPGVWYEAHIKTPTWERYGYHAALVPFALLLHNRQYAIGLTMFQNDDADLYVNSEITETLTETIYVKGEESIDVTVQLTDQGPIINDVLGHVEGDPMALWWIFLQEDMDSFEALYTLNHSDGIDGVRNGASKIAAPGLNVMYGDAEGNIAWWASGKLYLMNDSINRNFVLDASDSAQTARNWLSFSENPQAENPPWHYVYSTNNQPDSIKGGLYPGYYTSDNRGERIVSLLESKDKISVEDYKDFFLDKTSDGFSNTSKLIAENITAENDAEKAALDAIENWDGSHTKESIAPTVFYKLIFHITKEAMEELQIDDFVAFFNTPLMKRSVPLLISNEASPWWDDIRTEEKESHGAILQRAFEITVKELEEQTGAPSKWQWGNVHTLEHPHAMGKVALLKPFLNVGAYEMDAGDEVLNKLDFIRNASGKYPIVTAPSTRRIVNFADIENSLSILPSGQSGNPLSDHYDDQADMYAQGKWRKMMMNEEEIRKTSLNILHFKSE